MKLDLKRYYFIHWSDVIQTAFVTLAFIIWVSILKTPLITTDNIQSIFTYTFFTFYP